MPIRKTHNYLSGEIIFHGTAKNILFPRLPCRFKRMFFMIPIPMNWAEKDSNLRSRRQQIYSLPPLAARESAHAFLSSKRNFTIGT